ncbi:MAG: winged helix-turn-helix transcriptional regulator [candidate division NC10 bacterium]|nr:winged helix-turn-helix transcriptional regulator [candidate division NC10 bacterium]
MVSVFKVLGDECRLRILKALMQRELCVCELVDALRIPQYKVSRHLGTLRKAGLVDARRNGRWMYYSIGRSATLGFHHDLLKTVDSHLHGTPEGRRDDDRLSRRLAVREGGRCVIGKASC